MEKEKLEKFRAMLLDLRSKTASDFERAVSSSTEESGSELPDPNDEATRTINRRILMEISGKSHALLAQIDDALERIDQEEYGECVECGEEIPEKRLEVLPFARYCVECKQRKEKEGAGNG